ncbi:glycoside hydrolase family 36 protein [Cohnella lupini]|uniref:Alpha-galactosidase n=1 Tax=Cohnella lupini TaxID=1294267 RepID=A0A3D9IB99_9BACL|nr:alpha-galactosidase [Cohnella lupini]RED58486.1 alpha-galactosidase [Cohnella lupini]
MDNRRIEHSEGELRLVFEITDQAEVKLLHFAPSRYVEEELDNKSFANRRLVEVQCTGENGFVHHGMKHVGTLPGGRLKYRTHRLIKHDGGNSLGIEQSDEKTGLVVVSHYRFYDGLPLAKCWTEIRNEGTEALPVEYVSSFVYNGVSKEGDKPWDEKMRLHIPRNSWCGEVQWQAHSLPEWGLSRVFHHSVNRISINSQGTWSSYEHMPMAVLENTEAGSCLFWQIEHNGSWQWEISDAEVNQLYIRLSGPNENEGHWAKTLLPGEKFESVPVVAGAIKGDFTEATRQLTGYLRRVRRPAEDNRRLPVIFNDFMHALWGDPTTAKLTPFVDAAADSGCEIFCIDAGWYEGVLGEWLPSKTRFEGGLGAMIGYIKSKGMVPGLWLELESVDTASPLVARAEENWFFRKRGKRVVDAGRYQLDFRHPDVVRHADETVDRLVAEFGIGYFKFDYNQNAGIGTDVNAESAGDGLLGHNRAYLAWVDRLFERHPGLIVEACASGGMRMDYATLSRFSLQSVSDQMDYRLMGMIAAASPSLVPPEQAGVWAYPLKESDDEAVIFNMVNVIPFRVILGGQLHEVSESGRNLVREAIHYYKTVREFLPESVPSWPLGISTIYSDWTCLQLVGGSRVLIAVWRLNSDKEEIAIPLSSLQNKNVSFRMAYPAAATATSAVGNWESESGVLTVRLPQLYSARIIEATLS